MHVLIATHDVYPDPGSGGTGRYVYETARRMVDRGHRVSVLTRRRGDGPRRETVEGIDIFRYDVTIAGASAPAIARQFPTAARQVRDAVATLSTPEPPDVVSFQGPVTSLLVDRVVPDHRPRTITFHSPWPTEYAIRTRRQFDHSAVRRRLNVRIRHALEGRLLGRGAEAITLSEFMREVLRDRYGSDVETTVVPGGVDVRQFTPEAGRHDPVTDGDPAFLTVRRLAERMGHGRLLEAFATVAESVPDARLYVAGDGPLRARLERRARRLGVADRTEFLGYVPDEALPAAYATADVFVLPTEELEGFGLATLEALAAGTPVVGTPVGGTVELLSDLAGRVAGDVLLESADAGALADGMVSWANVDEDRLRRAGTVCRRYACENYRWDDCVSELLAVYRSRCR